jgi:hypothetical protein
MPIPPGLLIKDVDEEQQSIGQGPEDERVACRR